MTITNEELEKIKELKTRGIQLMNEFGRLKMDEMRLKKTSDELTKIYEEFAADEKNFLDKLSYKYGKSSIDMETGEIQLEV